MSPVVFLAFGLVRVAAFCPGVLSPVVSLVFGPIGGRFQYSQPDIDGNAVEMNIGSRI